MASSQNDIGVSLAQSQGLFRKSHAEAGVYAEDLGANVKKIEAYIAKAESMAVVREEPFYDDAIEKLKVLAARMRSALNDAPNQDAGMRSGG